MPDGQEQECQEPRTIEVLGSWFGAYLIAVTNVCHALALISI